METFSLNENRQMTLEELKKENEELKKELLEYSKSDYDLQMTLDLKDQAEQKLEKIKETLQDTEYIAQYDGTACDLSLELLQIIQEE